MNEEDIVNEYRRKVQYYETDMMGITHHANYIRWMEEARVDYFAKTGWGYERLEQNGIVSPVIGVELKYLNPTTFADEVIISVYVEEFRGVKMKIRYEMKKTDGTPVCIARSEHCFMDRKGHFIRMKRDWPELYETFAALLEGQGA